MCFYGTEENMILKNGIYLYFFVLTFIQCLYMSFLLYPHYRVLVKFKVFI